MTLAISFRERVFIVVRKIPEGETLSYGAVARRAGNPNAARAVGAILRTNHCSSIPCHRVIHIDGSLGGYNYGARRKHTILKKEGALHK